MHGVGGGGGAATADACSFGLLVLLLVSAATSAAAERIPHATVYRAEITEIPGTDSGVSGYAYVFASGDGSTIGYSGHANGLEPDLFAPSCTAENGCGVHVHAGFSCETAEGQAGHYFESPIEEDPWVNDRYSSNDQGQAKFSGIVDIGTDDLSGRAFLIHAEDGSRVACGLLRKVAGFKLLRARPSELSDSGVAATVTAHAVDDRICFFVTAHGLEPNIDSYLISSNTGGGVGGDMDCISQNGCGLHVHSGNSCHDADSQGGHYYNANTFTVDPWLDIGYLYTDSNGNAYHADCVETGETVYTDHAFLVHANDGSRIACDLLSKPGTDYCDYYCKRNDNYGYRHHEEWCNDCYNYCNNHY